MAEAERSKHVTRLVRGQLVRELAESLPDGWPADLGRDHGWLAAGAGVPCARCRCDYQWSQGSIGEIA